VRPADLDNVENRGAGASIRTGDFMQYSGFSSNFFEQKLLAGESELANACYSGCFGACGF